MDTSVEELKASGFPLDMVFDFGEKKALNRITAS